MIPISLIIGTGGILFALGIVCLTVRRSAIRVLMGVELMLNAANLNFVAFAHGGGVLAMEGTVMILMVMAAAAAEAAVALSIVVALYRNYGTSDLEKTSELAL